MKLRWNRALILALAVSLPLGTAACGKKEVPPPPPPADDGAAERARLAAEREAAERARREAEARAAEAAARAELARKRAALEDMVFFDYDVSAIREDQRGKLDAKAGVLREEGTVTLRIVGHADERGSTEYNLALGMQRAQSIKEYLTGFGISADRLQIQSMGEERPLEPGRDERAWSRNRRGEFQILTGLSGGN
ncbi:MAG TPA: OmpA family protein [Longimicrobiales bacterium]|nr:OmpA family protein [Longimicrobiales bacterium]